MRTNIAGFGGDPDNITLFGESAGADAIAHLMIADGTDGLFHRVILQSPPLGITRGRERMYAEMAAGIADLAPDSPVDEILERQGRVEAIHRRHGLRLAMPFGVQYGQAPLPEEDGLDDAWRRAAGDFDVLIGTNRDEVGLYAAYVPAMVKLATVPVIGRRLHDLLIRPLTAAVYTRATERLTGLLAEGGARTYLYRLHWGSGRTPMGACHMIDLPLLLGTPEVWAGSKLIEGLPLDEVQEAGMRVRAVWASFARTGELADEGRIEPDVLGWHAVCAD